MKRLGAEPATLRVEQSLHDFLPFVLEVGELELTNT